MRKYTSTKQKLLTMLKKEKTLTIDSLMIDFAISEIAVRKQLNELVRQGFIKKSAVKQRIGRPYFTYELTKKGHDTFPNHHEELPVQLLRDLEDIHGLEMVDDLLERRMNRHRKHLEAGIYTENFSEKVAAVARVQDEQGYMVELEQTENGDYQMKHFNCPILNIASDYKQVCNNEKVVFENIFSSSDVVSQTCITQGDHYCKWLITKPADE